MMKQGCLSSRHLVSFSTDRRMIRIFPIHTVLWLKTQLNWDTDSIKTKSNEQKLSRNAVHYSSQVRYTVMFFNRVNHWFLTCFYRNSLFALVQRLHSLQSTLTAFPKHLSESQSFSSGNTKRFTPHMNALSKKLLAAPAVYQFERVLMRRSTVFQRQVGQSWLPDNCQKLCWFHSFPRNLFREKITQHRSSSNTSTCRTWVLKSTVRSFPLTGTTWTSLRIRLHHVRVWLRSEWDVERSVDHH